MGYTGLGTQDASTSRFKVVSSLPQTPAEYYGVAANDVAGNEWKGGESLYLSLDRRIYMQVNTSGSTPKWRAFNTQMATSTSSSTSSSSTSTSTSTSSSTSSSSTSSSSTTTGA